MANQHNVRVSKCDGYNKTHLNNRNALFKMLLRFVSFLEATHEKHLSSEMISVAFRV